ncbi:hypothetical protein PLEOSDRAFT_1088290 [Pleurotus ostreatus PC15]|uniref:Uncharacterized protein n=1 Tax=Pleurotus ostreatus (strain PC15) TaxID=1137138 RepID=A0A067NQ36_PLEO1|nr:hypothetical protein PLEOSDRAFT_1088290 [Pleurotus ostreatus PC15]
MEEHVPWHKELFYVDVVAFTPFVIFVVLICSAIDLCHRGAASISLRLKRKREVTYSETCLLQVEQRFPCHYRT